MKVVVYPCLPSGENPGERLRLWVGVFGSPGTPALKWSLNGSKQTPTPLRSLSSFRTDDDQATGDIPPVYTGVYEYRKGLSPDTAYDVTVAATVGKDGSWSSVQTRTLPSEVPHGFDASLNVLLVSCFFRPRDPQGDAGRAVAQLPSRLKPHLSLLLGDQVYLDLPVLRWMPNDAEELARIFEAEYARTWRHDGYGQLLEAAPSAALPDDHEYWNNAPHITYHLPRTHTKKGRQNWYRAARQMYETFQITETKKAPEVAQFNRSVEVPPASFFLMDNRTFRKEDVTESLGARGLKLFDRWATSVIERRQVGVVVTGQSLFQPAASRLKGRVADRHLANYGDYGSIMKVIRKLVEAGRPVLCVTGDVHYGRVIEARLRSVPGNPLYEIIASPSSLVDSPFDAPKAVFRKIRDPGSQWSRHSEAKEPPKSIDGWQCQMIDEAQGDHVAILSLNRSPSGVDATVTYKWTKEDRAPKVVSLELHAGR